MTLELTYCLPVSEKDDHEAEFYQDSLGTSYTRSSSVEYFMSEDDGQTCEVSKRYRDAKTYLNSSTSGSDSSAYSARSLAML